VPRERQIVNFAATSVAVMMLQRSGCWNVNWWNIWCLV